MQLIGSLSHLEIMEYLHQEVVKMLGNLKWQYII